MALFQKNVLARYISAMDAQQIDAAYTQFVAYFHNTERQQNILTSKEEQFQEGFLRELFVKILGYTLNPDPDYNLITEKKDVNDSKKADGAILLNDEVIGIIELKDHKTPDLSKVERQAFGYKNQHPKAKYVVISNFQKLRFYIDNAVEHMEWNLFTLTREEFAELWLCLQYDNISRHLPATVKSESLSREEQITNQLYKDYIDFKRVLFEDILRRNTTDEGEHSTAEWKILLFKKTQKLLDRLLFIFFAEDRDLLPPNSMREIIKQWRQLIELDEDVRLYSRIKKYFGYMNEGHKGKHYDIFAYNGGLFKPDEVLDNLDIDDNLLAEHTLRLSEYDYASEVDVNILGHIFENSLSEIEEVTAQLQNGEAPTVSKRKKDGVFYTPQYITRYIVDNTLGKLCREKREAMGLVEEDYYDAQTRQLKTKQRMMDLLTEYREWLLSLTICDPACGSGAFLNAALQFLIDEHKSLDKMEAALTNSDIEFPNIENSILENNLYGVDINEESVEIARLALWLRTAKPFRKLTTLNGNIKCGNSLISDPAIAGDKAFDWQKEFPQVFEKGGFDIIIGNPPYFNIETMGHNSAQANAIMRDYSEIWQDKSDILFYFIYKALKLSKSEVGFIVSNAFLFSDKAKKLRNKIIEDNRLSLIVNFEQYHVFEDAAITSCIILFNKKHDKRHAIVLKDKTYTINQVCDIIENDNNQFEIELSPDNVFALVNSKVADINKHIDANHQPLQNICTIGSGMQTAANDVFLFDTYPSLFPDEFIRKRVSGELIAPYCPVRNTEWLLYVEDADSFEELPSVVQEHLMANKDALSQRADKQRRATARWWDYTFAMHKELYSRNKIWCSYRSKSNAFVLDETSDFVGLTNTTVIFDTNPQYSLKYLLVLLNSKLLTFRYKSIGKQTGSGVYEYFANGVGKFPVPACDDQQPFIDLADRMLSLNKDLQQKRARFLRRMSDNFAGLKVTASLENFDTLTFADFVKELGKQKIRLTLVQQDEWEEYFNQYATECQTLTQTIQATDTQIDELVYSLYNLTEPEKEIIRKG